MKREIKFRAWDKKYNVMLCAGFNIIGEVTLFNGVEVMLMEQSKLHKDDTPSLLRLNDVEIMQYIGQKDKNGIGVYEGDVDQYGGIVTWNEDSCAFCIYYPTGELMPIECLSEWMIVSGNIYENHELIKS